MILPRGSLRRPGRVPLPLTSLRERLLHIDGELARAADPDPWLGRAAALARRADPDPGHGTRVAELAGRLALVLGWPAASAEQLRRAAELHDIGKFALSRSLLLHPGPLGPGQRELLILHTHAAAWLLGGLDHPVLRLACLIGRAHHERWDGGGYPDRAAGADIPLPARIVAACDVWDALTHPRPYRAALSPAEAADTLRSMAGTALDPDLGAALLDLLDPCPRPTPVAT
ncbi:MAG TPA: HD domain-containing phosphohydrolase [Longimicrobiaceae bacterium]|nr:HD domain-containing phosphohydrolase [Longimicrobiaceae bacterium]